MDLEALSLSALETPVHSSDMSALGVPFWAFWDYLMPYETSARVLLPDLRPVLRLQLFPCELKSYSGSTDSTNSLLSNRR